MATEAGEGALAARLAARLVPSARGYERSGAAWLDARRHLGDALARRLAAR
jgi:hypothetical protein